MSYAAYTDVQPRLGGRTLTTTSTVTQAQVTAWIAETEAELDAELAAIDLTTPVTGVNPLLIVLTKVVDKVTARVLRSWAVGTRLEGDGAAAAAAQKEWDDFITLIRERQALVASMLGQSQSGVANRGVFRSHITDNSHGKSVSAGDFDPKFTKDMDN